ncbi:CU044_5270 family protein [Streptomyces sp. NPDC053367]|uniref:CU044_5270 family protein n=1 Tax=Streptomyces sp. NPDC053367 TaxID=3365700 RepID=UPI0037CCDDB3
MSDRNLRADGRGDAATDADVAEITRLLPAPACPDLPRAQHLRHKEQLMQHIDRDQSADTRRPARRRLRPVLLLPVTALALGGILTAGVTLGTGDDVPPGTAAARTVQPVAALLGRISDAAGQGDALTVRGDQFVYTRAMVRGADLTSGKAVVGPLTESERWLAQEPGPLRTLGLAKENGRSFRLNAELGDPDGTPAGFGRPTYQWLASLPADPGELLARLYAQTPETTGRERDQAVFDRIGDLLGELMPPDTAAALYRAAARIPGVTEAPAAHDVIGRHGVGIARTDTTFHTRTEWVFDQRDLSFLGARSYLVENTSYGRKGTLLSGTAVLEHAVVDTAGQEPAVSSAGSGAGAS